MKRLSLLPDEDELDRRLDELDFLLERQLDPDFFFLPFFFFFRSELLDRDFLRPRSFRPSFEDFLSFEDFRAPTLRSANDACNARS
jgi:hypothetical protein